MANETRYQKTFTSADLKSKLTDVQFKVTQKDGTEPPFKNEFWDNKEPGIYVDIVSGEPLFSSLDKFDSGTGWPSFTKPLEAEHVVSKEDKSLFHSRTEVRSKYANSHLGHVFDDGPKPTGKRFCINSASLKFIPVKELAAAGYGNYAELFEDSAKKKLKNDNDSTALATFAGGCFWCMESPFEKLPGVSDVVSGYTGGRRENPSYEQVSAGGTGHTEAIQITYDPKVITYEDLLAVFWRNINPTDSEGQFVDRGNQYRAEVFYHSEEQKAAAEKSKAALEKSGRFNQKIVTEITKASPFFRAEEYHQDYYKKNPIRYNFYRNGSGRDSFLDKIWKKDQKK